MNDDTQSAGRRLKTGIIGCGNFGRQHAQRLISLADVELRAFCSRSLDKAAAFNAEFAAGKGGAYTDCERMFGEAALDMVYICLPPYAHGREVELACRHGVHIFIEKPIALDLDLARSMVAHVRAAGVKSQVGFHYRFGAAVRQLRQIQRARPSDERGFMTARYECNSLHSEWWRDRARSGGQFVEQAIHLADMARHLLGEPVEVYAAQDNVFHRGVPGYTAEDVTAAIIRFETGSLAAINSSNGAIPNRWEYDWRISLPGLVADFEHPNRAVIHHTHSKPVVAETVSDDRDLYLEETLDLIAAIREDRPAAVPIEKGLRSLALVLAARESAERRQPVAVGDASQ
jgi:predicted dehydrogenase